MLKAIVAVQENKADNMTYNLLGEFQIDSNAIQKLWYVGDMIE